MNETTHGQTSEKAERGYQDTKETGSDSRSRTSWNSLSTKTNNLPGIIETKQNVNRKKWELFFPSIKEKTTADFYQMQR